MSSEMVPVVLAASVVCLAMVVLVRGKKKKVVTRLPAVQGEMSETFSKLNSGKETPFFLLDIARSLAPGKRVFRLNLPAMLPPFVIVADAKSGRQVLTSKGVDKPKDVFYKEFAGLSKGVPSLFTMPSSNPRQGKQRKGAAPAFSARRVEKSVNCPAFDDVNAELFRLLDNGEPFDPAEVLTMAMIDTLGRVSLGGVDFGTLRDLVSSSPDEEEEGKSGTEGSSSSSSSSSSLWSSPRSPGATFLEELPLALVEFSTRRMFNPLRKYYWRLTASGNRAALASERLWSVAEHVLSSFHQREEEKKNKEDGAASTILAHIVENRSYASDRDRVADLLLFLIAGHDTTGYSLAFALYEITKKGPAFAATLREEVARGDQQGQDSLFERTCREALRLWPVAAMGSFREVVDPNGLRVKTDDLDLHLPQGTILDVPFLPIMRTAPGVPNPDTFDPDRWLDTTQLDALKESFYPFSLGQRNCVGMALANAELKALLVALVTRYDFEMVKDFTPDYFLTLKPMGGLLKATPLGTP